VLGESLFAELFKHLMTKQGIHGIDTLFNTKDKQNVPLAYKLLRAVVNIKDLDMSEKPTLANQFAAVKLLGAALEGLLAPITSTKSTVGELLTGLSKSLHIVFVLYRLVGM
jgi:hypothetical protein